MTLLDKLDRRWGRWAVPRLTLLLVFAQLSCYVFNILQRGFVDKLVLYPELLLQGQVWRLVTFLFVPPCANPLFIVFALYIFWMFGSHLEYQWGEFKYNVFILMGWFAAALPAILYVGLMQVPALQGSWLLGRLGAATGTNYYIGMTVLFAFATYQPRFELLIFFVLPVQIRFIAWFTAGLALIGFLFGDILHKAQFVLAMGNYLLFFGGQFLANVRTRARREEYEARVKVSAGASVHRCGICGRTEHDDPDLEFRVCSACGQEFCQDHRQDHDCNGGADGGDAR